MKRPVHWLALLCLSLTACAGGNVSTPPSPNSAAAAAAEQPLSAAPDGTRWRLVESTLPGLEAGAGTGIRIEFVEGRLAGDSGCNRFSAPLGFSGEAIKLGIVMSTKRACLDGRGAAERSLYDALPGVSRAVRVGEQLRLEHADGGWMLFDTDPTVAE
jgi:heat shock protein HslJ